MRSRACVLMAAVLLSGCGASVQRERTLVGRRETWLAERPAPAVVTVRADTGGVLLRVKRQGCIALVQGQQLVEDRVITTARQGPLITGVALAAVGGFLILTPEGDQKDAAMGSPKASGILMVGAGMIVLLAQRSDSEETSRRVLNEPPHEAPSECRHASDAVATVALVLPDGDLLPAEETDTGLWRVQLPESVWQRFGRSFHTGVRVDGAVTHGVRLSR